MAKAQLKVLLFLIVLGITLGSMAMAYYIYAKVLKQAIDEGALASEDLRHRLFRREPPSAVDLGKGLHAPALRRPFHLE